MEKATYIVSATVQFDLEISVEATSEDEVREQAIKDVKSFYRLDAVGGPHEPSDVEVKVFYIEPA